MTQVSDENMQKIEQLIYNGKKIEAIKMYREFSGKGLRDSKEAVDMLAAELKKLHPEKFVAQASQGCLVLLTLGISLSYLPFRDREFTNSPYLLI